MIGFEIPSDLEAIRRRVAEFVQTEVIPVESQVTQENFEEVLTELRKRAREAGLWTRSGPPVDRRRPMGTRPGGAPTRDGRRSRDRW